MSSPEDRAPVSLNDEAVRLVEALQGWLGAHTGSTTSDDTWARATAGDVGAAPGEAPECTVCPLCRSMRFLRTMRPESVEPIVGAASALAAALQELRRQAETARAARPEPPPGDTDTWD